MNRENLDEAFLREASIANLMLLSGQPQRPVDALFLHNRSYGDYTGLYKIAKEMLRRRIITFIIVTNNEGERFGSDVKFEANPGKTECIRMLTEEFKVPRGRILVPNMEARHTRQENTAFLDLSIQRAWRSAVIIAQPHQLLRATLGMVQAMDQKGYWMEIYTAAPFSTPWFEVVKGNQGIEEKPRFKYIPDEMKRVYQYQATGELATFEQLFNYLKTREEGNLPLGPIERGSVRFSRDLPPNLQGDLAL